MIGETITQASEYLVSIISRLDYIGIFILMAIESTIFPLPSEIVLIPAGVLVQRGEMGVFLIVLFATLGSLVGSLIMYALSLYLGRSFIDSLILKYGKFLFLDEAKLMKAESYFKKHGDITIFISRLLPVVRHLVSIPAGFAKMSLPKFCFYTILGSALWSLILVYTGYFFGIAIAEQNIHLITLIFAIFSLLIIVLYVIANRSKNFR